MRIGVPKEIKNHEYRVGMTPPGVHELTTHGHQVLVETNAGHQIGIDDSDFMAAGATIAGDAAEAGKSSFAGDSDPKSGTRRRPGGNPCRRG